MAHIVARGFPMLVAFAAISGDDFKHSATFSTNVEHDWAEEKHMTKDAKGSRMKQEKAGK